MKNFEHENFNTNILTWSFSKVMLDDLFSLFQPGNVFSTDVSLVHFTTWAKLFLYSNQPVHAAFRTSHTDKNEFLIHLP